MSFSDNEYKIHKQLCVNILESLRPVRQKLEKLVIKQHLKLEQKSSEISKQDDIALINSLSVEIEKEKASFIKNLALLSAVENIIVKNEERLSFIDEHFKSVGIYIEKVDKKELKAQMAQINKLDLESSLTFANPSISQGYFVFFKGRIFEINKGYLNLSTQHNKYMLENFADSTLSFALTYYPKSISTIDVESLLNVSLKKKLLKQIVYFVADKISNMSIKEIDEMLGGILNFSYAVPSSLKAYIEEVTNLFNVKIKTYIKDNYEVTQKQLDGLSCNEKSKFLFDNRSTSDDN